MSPGAGAFPLDFDRGWESGAVPRLLRCAAAEIPNVALERKDAGLRLTRGAHGEPIVHCFVRVAQDCDCERPCSALVRRLETLLRHLQHGEGSRVEVTVTGRYSRSPKKKTSH